MLADANLLPRSNRRVSDCIKNFDFSKKNFLEVERRNRVFLRFLQAHGAVVAGTTGGKYFRKARKLLGAKAVLANTKAKQAGEFKELQKFRPHFIVSVNLLD